MLIKSKAGFRAGLLLGVLASVLAVANGHRHHSDHGDHGDYETMTTSSGYDYFLFVRQWGVTFCAHGSCAVKPVERFSVHGLWPERYDHSWPQCCDSHYPFTFDKIVPLLGDLTRYWFSYVFGCRDQCAWNQEGRAVAQAPAAQVAANNGTAALVGNMPRALLQQQQPGEEHGTGGEEENGDSPNYQFWRHEWEKHGTCALDVFGDHLPGHHHGKGKHHGGHRHLMGRHHKDDDDDDDVDGDSDDDDDDEEWDEEDKVIKSPEYRYFSAVVELAKKYDLDAMLAGAGITPSSQAYRTRDLVNAIRDGTGHMPVVSCRDDSVNEVRMCFSKKLKLMDCPSSSFSNEGSADELVDGTFGCSSKIYLLPASSVTAADGDVKDKAHDISEEAAQHVAEL